VNEVVGRRRAGSIGGEGLWTVGILPDQFVNVPETDTEPLQDVIAKLADHRM
jgi:hypothetical protein